jgi:chemotaxis protein methyltransferase CheR
MSLLLAPFQVLIKARTGLMLEDSNSLEKLHSALIERIAAQKNSRPEAYLAQLGHDHEEFQALINHLTINETYFFRESEQIELLVNQLIPRLLVNRTTQEPIRILSAGCSSGEEPYSLVMALTEKYGEQAARLFQIIGGDIDSRVLAKARAGIYSDFSFRGVKADIRHRYFTRQEYQNKINDSIREQVSFYELNLLESQQKTDLSRFDIIFFRNVSIYFDTPTRKIIQQNLSAMLRENGILVIGTAETLANDLGVLPMVEEQGLFYFVKGKIATQTPRPQRLHTSVAIHTPVVQVTTDKPTIITPTNTPQPLRPFLTFVADKQQLAQLIRDKRYDAALPITEALLAHNANDHEAQVIKAYILLNRKQWLAAEGLLKSSLEINHWLMDSMMLLGLCAKWQGNHQDATNWFKKAVYAHSDSWLAHYHLADSYRHNEPPLALRSYRTALQLLNKQPDNTGLKILPLELLPSEARFLCEHQINKLTQDNAGKGNA